MNARNAIQPVVRTLLVSDVVNSTRLVKELGDRKFANLDHRHDRLARDLLPEHEALEIDKTDGFLLLFERPLHPYTVGLLGSVPSANKRGVRLNQIPGMTPSLLDLPPGCAFRARCARASERCVEEPPVETLGEGRRARCFHPHGTSP